MEWKFVLAGIVVGVAVAYFRTKSQSSPAQAGMPTQRSYNAGQGYGG